MKGFQHISRVVVPRSIAEESNAGLRHIGMAGLEGFALWAGIVQEDRFMVKINIVPEQTGYDQPSGVCVVVGPEELHRLNVWLYQNNMSVIAQLHTHPTNAYHSDTDDAFPIATTIGCISIVIPNFARQGFSLSRCAVYRLSAGLEWLELKPKAASDLIRIVES